MPIRKITGFVLGVFSLFCWACSSAIAQTVQHTAAAPGSIWKMYLFIVPVLLLFLYLSQRPQAKRAKEQKAMLSNLAANSEVVTIGGITGIVTRVEEDFVILKTSQSSTMRIQKRAIATVYPTGTLKLEN